jgi:hypothetical protein
MTHVRPARHLLRAKGLIDARYLEPLDVPALVHAAPVSPRTSAANSGGFGGRRTNPSNAEARARGVEFLQEPTEQPYGIDAGFRDPSGNQFRMARRR